MYILLNNNRVKEIIPDVDPRFPEVPIGKRYEERFVKSLLHVEDGTEVRCGMVYNAGSGEFCEDKAPHTEFVVTVAKPKEDETLRLAISELSRKVDAVSGAVKESDEVLYTMLGEKPETREEAIEKSRQYGHAVRMYAESLDEERGADVHMLRGKRGKGGSGT